MLCRTSTGFGALALAGLLPVSAGGKASSTPVDAARRFRARAKNVIFCYMQGGVSHVDSFDPKPRLDKEAGEPMPVKIERTMFNENGNIFPSPFEFRRYGESGIPVSSMFPHVATCADDLAIVRSMTTKANEHAQGNYAFHTGFPFIGHPSAGAWVSYGLGTENENLPGFVVLRSGDSPAPHGGVGMFGGGYLPSQHQASFIEADKKHAIANIFPAGSRRLQRERIDFIRSIDAGFIESLQAADPVEAAVRNYETAYAMQSEVPELCDLSGETHATKQLYGLDSPDEKTAAYARQCLLARRLVERGVRFVELTCLGGPNTWDQHGELEKRHGENAFWVDQPIAGLLKDLKSRGLLDETLVVWSGEFGRTPFHQGSDGRDHNPFGFSLWLAGGGVRGGTIHGATDEYGYRAIENPHTVYDLWATVLYLLGVDHVDLTYRYGGRDVRLTDVHGSVINEIIA